MNNSVHFITTTACFFFLIDWFFFLSTLETPTTTISLVYRVQQCLTWRLNTQLAHFLGAFTPSVGCDMAPPVNLFTPVTWTGLWGPSVCWPGLQAWKRSEVSLFCLIMASYLSKQWFWVGINHHLVLSAGNYHLYWKHTGKKNTTQTVKVTGVKESLSSMQHVWLMRCGDMRLGLTSLPHQSAEMGEKN